MWGDLEMQKEIRVDERGDQKDRRERASDEGDESVVGQLAARATRLSSYSPHDESRAFLGELVDVLLGNWIAPVEPPFEQMGQLVELAEFPLRVRCVLSPAD